MRESGCDPVMSYALHLLGYRMRTEQELKERLEKKGYDREAVSLVVDRLKQWGYLDDQKYVESYLRSKVKPTGRSMLRYELQRKGVQRELVEAELARCFSPDQEFQAAEDLALKLWRVVLRTKGENGELAEQLQQKNLQKIAAKLLARGFSYDIISKIITKLQLRSNNYL